MGMPRRYQVYAPEFQIWHVLSSAGAAVLAVAYLMPLGYLGYSLWRGERAGRNPWRATGLEWTTPSPPPSHNFLTVPRIVADPYDYHGDDAPVPDAADSFRPQGG
jgi:cytochrome c oxidase subunit 1